MTEACLGLTIEVNFFMKFDDEQEPAATYFTTYQYCFINPSSLNNALARGNVCQPRE